MRTTPACAVSVYTCFPASFGVLAGPGARQCALAPTLTGARRLAAASRPPPLAHPPRSPREARAVLHGRSAAPPPGISRVEATLGSWGAVGYCPGGCSDASAPSEP